MYKKYKTLLLPIIFQSYYLGCVKALSVYKKSYPNLQIMK